MENRCVLSSLLFLRPSNRICSSKLLSKLDRSSPPIRLFFSSSCCNVSFEKKRLKFEYFYFEVGYRGGNRLFFLKSRGLFYLFPFFPRDQERCHHPLEPDIYESARIGGIFNGRKKRSITQFLFRTITYRRKNELAYSELAYKTHNPSNRQPISTPSFDSVRKKKRKEIERPIFFPKIQH